MYKNTALRNKLCTTAQEQRRLGRRINYSAYGGRSPVARAQHGSTSAQSPSRHGLASRVVRNSHNYAPGSARVVMVVPIVPFILIAGEQLYVLTLPRLARE